MTGCYDAGDSGQSTEADSQVGSLSHIGFSASANVNVEVLALSLGRGFKQIVITCEYILVYLEP